MNCAARWHACSCKRSGGALCTNRRRFTNGSTEFAGNCIKSSSGSDSMFYAVNRKIICSNLILLNRCGANSVHGHLHQDFAPNHEVGGHHHEVQMSSPRKITTFTRFTGEWMHFVTPPKSLNPPQSHHHEVHHHEVMILENDGHPSGHHHELHEVFTTKYGHRPPDRVCTTAPTVLVPTFLM